jgi:transcriptional regulator with XRE-family HTH domain
MGFYQRLRDLKEDSDMTQKQVAEIIGVSINHYGKYERGETDIPFEKAIILADFYNVSLDYLAGRTNNKHGKMNPEITTEELRLLAQYRKLSERSKGRHDVLLSQLIAQQEDAEYVSKETG